MDADRLQVLRLVVIEEARKVARALPHDHDLNLALRALDRIARQLEEQEANR
jgi:hypothetical protein